jgi:hypothetical protein
MATVIDTLSRAARHGMIVRAECGCGNVRYYRAMDLALEYGGGIDPRELRFRCTACKPNPVKVVVLEIDHDRRPRIDVWRPHRRDGRVVWMPERYR